MSPFDPGAVAIVSVAGRFPGAPTIEAFWENLCTATESILRYTPEELDALGVEPELRAHPKFVPAGALLDGIDRFDAALFGFSRREAEVLDPQHRLFFECVWEAIERAGYAPGLVREPVGLFAGTSLSTYLIYNLIPEGQAIRDVGLHQIYIANDKDSLTTHVSYKLNLRGPSVTVQTACSTSLVAVQFACQSLLAYQCDMAVAGGVSIQVPHLPGYVYQEGGIASPDGRCRAFDRSAAGTVSGNGAGAVVLKRLEDAIADRDPIVAVIRGAAINNDGAAKIGYTAPSADGQAEVVVLAQGLAGVTPDTIGYIEAHGTGTPLGDPIELAALTRVFASHTSRRHFCAIGSVKTNIGHLDAAAGIAGLIKTALAVQHGIVPASLHFTGAGADSGLNDGPFFVADRTLAWPLRDGPRRAGVSSFGIGGTNAHVVLEEPPPRPASAASRPLQLLTLSARSAQSADRLMQETAVQLDDQDVALADAAFTLHVGRGSWPHRRVVIAASRSDAVQALRDGGAGVLRAGITGRPPAVAFLFPGQGTQASGMARALYESERVFRTELDACCEELRPHLDVDLRALLIGASHQAAGSDPLTQTALAQPALFATEYALARLWQSWGVRPDAMLGHSLGEYVAACIAGVCSLADALRLIAIRGRLMQALPPGAMLAVSASEEEIAPLLGDELSLAAVNGPRATVASGPIAAIDALAATLAARGLACRRLETSHAFHSAMMEPMLDAFGDELTRVRFSPPELAYVSNVTGTWIESAAATDPAYWLRHLRQPVRFAAGLATLLGDGTRVALEVGIGSTLSNLTRAASTRNPQSRDPEFRNPQSGDPQSRNPQPAIRNVTVTDALADLWLRGVDIDWHQYHAGEQRHRILMPVTPFERQRYWIDPPSAARDIGEWLYEPQWSPAAVSLDSVVAPRRILIVGGSPAVVDPLAMRLARDGHRVSAETVDRLAAVSKSAVADDTALVVIYAGAMLGRDLDLDETRRRAFETPLTIARALADVPAATLLFIASDSIPPVLPVLPVVPVPPIQPVGPVPPVQALMTGPALVIPQEYPHLRCRTIVVDATDAEWSDAVARELDRDEPLVAIRGGVRMTRHFIRAGRDRAGTSRLQRGGVYWITGASGGIGRALADHLARGFGARLLLTSRTMLAPEVVAALETAGAEVLALTADVTDAGAMRAAAAAAVARFGRIDGIVHAAGVPGGGVIALKSPEASAAVLAPKVDGTVILADIAREQQVTFLALCSSLASLQGGFGQADYVAANAFLDAFAAWHTRESGIFTVSIGWDAWRETGMAVAVAAELHARAAGSDVAPSPLVLPQGLFTREGIAAFDRILAGTASQVAVSTTDLHARIAALRDGVGMTRVAAVQRARANNGDGLSIDASITALWRGVLGDDAPAHGNFFDEGGDSLRGVQLVARVNERFALEIPVARFFGAPTAASLAALVRQSTVPAREPAEDQSSDPSLDPSRERGRRRSERRRGRLPA